MKKRNNNTVTIGIVIAIALISLWYFKLIPLYFGNQPVVPLKEIVTKEGGVCSFQSGIIQEWDWVQQYRLGKGYGVKTSSSTPKYYLVYDIQYKKADTKQPMEEFLLSAISDGGTYSSPSPIISYYPNGYEFHVNEYLCPAGQIPVLNSPVEEVENPADINELPREEPPEGTPPVVTEESILTFVVIVIIIIGGLILIIRKIKK